MDIATLKAVIETLEAQVAHNKNMLDWSARQWDSETYKEDMTMWSARTVDSKEALEKVQEMLDTELDYRMGEAA